MGNSALIREKEIKFGNGEPIAIVYTSHNTFMLGFVSNRIPFSHDVPLLLLMATTNDPVVIRKGKLWGTD
jgi:hypothetical protein